MDFKIFWKMVLKNWKKKKKREISFIQNSAASSAAQRTWLAAFPRVRLGLPACGPPSPLPRPAPAWAEPKSRPLAQLDARAPSFPGVTLTNGAHASAASPSSSSPRRTSASPSFLADVESLSVSSPFHT
jgi:hypothetical protein